MQESLLRALKTQFVIVAGTRMQGKLGDLQCVFNWSQEYAGGGECLSEYAGWVANIVLKYIQ